MRENADKCARMRSGRQDPAADQVEGAADRLARVVPGRGSGRKEQPTASRVLFPGADPVRRSGRPAFPLLILVQMTLTPASLQARAISSGGSHSQIR